MLGKAQARLLMLMVWAALPAGLSSAQDEAPEPEAEVVADADADEISIGEFAIEAGAVEERLERIREEIAIFDVASDIRSSLDAIDEDGAELRDQFQSLSGRRAMSSELNTLQTQLELQEVRAARQVDRLTVYAADLEELQTQNKRDLELWKKAFRSARRGNVPKPVLDRTASILQGLRESQDELASRMAEVLELEARALDVRQQIRTGQKAIVEAQREQADAIFERQDAPLWQPAAHARGVSRREGYGIGFSWSGVEASLRRDTGLWLFALVLVLTLGWSLVRVRAAIADRASANPQIANTTWVQQAIEAVKHPWSAALLVGIAALRLADPARAVEMIVLTWFVAIPLWYIVYKEMVPASFRPVLIGLVALGTLHIVMTLVSGHPAFERALLLLELSLAAAGAAWLVRFLRTADVPERLRRGFWYSLSSVWAQLVFLIAMLGLVAGILGYTSLASESALVAIILTIAATAYMAVARIFEAIVSTSVYVGKLDALRMVRANRDVTARTLRRAIRVIAVVVYLGSAADMTSIWRPIGRTVGNTLAADLGLGFVETGVSLGDFFAFFFVLWLSWVIARLVSFLLREELFPRLHTQPGVPFAVTTFTRYAIIAIGFMGALSVLGVSLDRVTIALSALGVGVGFGLQNVVNNFVSGFILLTERPIRLRDKVEIGGVLGNVSNIGIRASTIRTFDGAEVIVPNGDLISQKVINWTLSARRQRVTIPVGVAYGTDPTHVLKILRQVAAAHDGVFKDPQPLALFRGFGESSLDFELRIFMDPSDVLDVPSEVTVAINDALNEAGIVIPFPQRDVHVRGLPEGLEVAGADADENA